MSTATLMQTVASFEETIKQDETVGPVVKEIERSMFFTDVPDCGAMKFNPSCQHQDSPEIQDDVSRSVLSFCGSLERAFCFSDLQDVQEEDIERLRSMKSLQENEEEKTEKENTAAPVTEQPVADTDTESMSDDSAAAAKETAELKREDSEAVKAVKAAVVAATTEAVVKSGVAKDAVLPPKNAFQSSTNKTKSGKPLNAMQAAKLAKKAEKEAKKQTMAGNKKKKWGLFRKSATTTKMTAV